MANQKNQFKKGVLDIVVLNIISEGDTYGYDLINTLDSQSQGYYLMKEGSLYPILYRLEDKGYIESYRKTLQQERAVPRKYYKITASGSRILEDMKSDWHEFVDITNTLLK